MRIQLRVSLVALVVSAIVAVLAPAAAQAAPGVAGFFAANCKEAAKCKKEPKETPAQELKKAKEVGFTQAGGHPPDGVTEFGVNTTKAGVPEGVVTHIRTDVAPGVSTNPQAVPMCSMEEFDGKLKVGPVEFAHGELPGSGFFAEPKCQSSTELGVNEAEVFAGFDLELEGKVYNLVQPVGLASDFGVALKLETSFTKPVLEKTFEEEGHPFKEPALEKALEETHYFAHTLIEGNVEWGAEAEGTGKADYHDYFNINVSPKLPLIKSRLVFNGNAGEGDFLTNPSSCSGIGPQTTTTLHLTFEGDPTPVEAKYSTPIGTEECGLVPFEPGFALTQSSKASDAPDGISTELSLKHNVGAAEIDDSQVKEVTVALPEGLTLNPSGANGLEACTTAQFGIGTKNPVKCPEGSKIGTVTLNVPGLPPGSLQGSVYLGPNAENEESATITGQPYIIYVAAESERYGVIVRVKGRTTANEKTGQLTASFTENPEQPFSNLAVHFNTGSISPLANSLKCEASAVAATFTPFTKTAAKTPMANFEVTGCAATLPFAPTQETSVVPEAAGAESDFTFELTRPQGQQYVEKLSTVLPAGVVAKIPTVTQCSAVQAVATQESGKGCPNSSQVGTVRVAAGSGSPFTFLGKVYLTAAINGAPYGLAFKVPVVAGPFKFTEEVTIATINVNPNTARVTIAATLPTIKDGIPVRIRSMRVDISRPNYILNPTNCSVPHVAESTVTSTLGTTAPANSSLAIEGCSSLAFKPSFTASTSGKPSKANGASLVTTITQGAGQSNIKSVFVQLPKQLPSRLTTLQQACALKVFEADPRACASSSPGSEVGTASAVTPVLPNVMTGPAFLVSHAGEEFPSLELVLEADGVRVIVEGKTHIKNGITTTNFESTPDVPVSSITVNLPLGPHSALATEKLSTNLCTAKLIMPTVITGQNGVVVKQNTIIKPTGCGVQIVGHKAIGNNLYLTVETYEGGRITGSGSGLSTTRRTLSAASKAATLKIPLSRRGRSRHRPFKVKVRVGFAPKKKGAKSSSATVTVRF